MSKLEGCRGSIRYTAIERAVRATLDPAAIEREVLAYLHGIPAPGEDAGAERVAAELVQAEKEVQNWETAIGYGGDVPAFVAKWKAAQARMDALRASLESAQAVVERQAELDPEDLVEALRLSQDGTPDLTADRKVLRSMGVQITVDGALKQAVIQGSLGQVVAGRLRMPNPQNLWEAGG